MTNYNALREEGQGFYLAETTMLYEKPDSVTASFVALNWWCDLEFSSDDATNNYGYVGRAVHYILGSSLEDAMQLHKALKYPQVKSLLFLCLLW